MRRTAAGLLLVTAALAARCACAEDAVDSMTITADHLSFDYKRSIAVFEGNVVVVDPHIQMESDKLTVLFEHTNSVKSVTAVGRVRMRSGDRTANCRKAVYLARTGEVLMSGSVRLTQGRDTITGDTVTFWLNDERVEVSPATLVIFPERDFELLPGTDNLRGGGRQRR